MLNVEKAIDDELDMGVFYEVLWEPFKELDILYDRMETLDKMLSRATKNGRNGYMGDIEEMTSYIDVLSDEIRSAVNLCNSILREAKKNFVRIH